MMPAPFPKQAPPSPLAQREAALDALLALGAPYMDAARAVATCARAASIARATGATPMPADEPAPLAPHA